MSRVFANKHFARLVVISQALKEEYLRLFDTLTPDQIIVAHDGADSDQIPKSLTQSQDYSQKGEALKVGYIGSLLPGKGMEIIHELAQQAPDCEFHVVGGTEEDLAKWKSKTLPENIIFHGFVQPERVYEFMEMFDVMLAPYQSKVITGGARKRDIGRWMSPLKLFEYMGAGKPIIASDLPVLREVIRDGENALLADPDDMDAWIEQIYYFRDHPSERERIGKNAQQDFFSTYTWDKRAELLLNSINNKKHHEHA
jgi:glycosyltransferase involved in cell wall biosynthesis